MLQLNWMRCGDSKQWCSFQNVDLSHPHFKGLSGVYIIFYQGSPGKVVRVGQGDIADRLTRHRNDPEVTRYKDLLVTWASVPANQLDGVEKYLADIFDPLVGDRFPDRRPIQVNSPFD